MYSLQSIAKPSLVYTLLHWKPLSLTSQAILVFSPLKPKIRGRCQVSSYLLVSVLFFFFFFLKIKEMGTLVGYLYLPQDVSTKRKLNQRFQPKSYISLYAKWLHREKVFGRRANISSLQRLLQFCNKLHPLFSWKMMLSSYSSDQ